MAWGRKNRRPFPWRETPDPWRVLVAEVMLQRSRGSTVAKVYEAFFRRWPDVESLARARASTIADVVRPLGLVRRAGTLRTLAAEVVTQGRVPDSLDALIALPGVGRYAASATMAVAFGMPVPTVDGVTARVYRRYFGLEASKPPSVDTELWAVVEEVTPGRSVREWNWAVLDLAATVCLPAKPKCPDCPLKDRCRWALERRVAQEC